MKFALAILIIVSIFSVAYVGMNLNEHAHGGCIAAAARGVDCPTNGSALDFISFHLGALKGLSLAIFGDEVSGILLVFVALGALFGFALAAHIGMVLPQAVRGNRTRSDQELFSSPLVQALLAWLAIHEKSPSASYRRR